MPTSDRDLILRWQRLKKIAVKTFLLPSEIGARSFTELEERIRTLAYLEANAKKDSEDWK